MAVRGNHDYTENVSFRLRNRHGYIDRFRPTDVGPQLEHYHNEHEHTLPLIEEDPSMERFDPVMEANRAAQMGNSYVEPLDDFNLILNQDPPEQEEGPRQEVNIDAIREATRQYEEAQRQIDRIPMLNDTGPGGLVIRDVMPDADNIPPPACEPIAPPGFHMENGVAVPDEPPNQAMIDASNYILDHQITDPNAMRQIEDYFMNNTFPPAGQPQQPDPLTLIGRVSEAIGENMTGGRSAAERLQRMRDNIDVNRIGLTAGRMYQAAGGEPRPHNPVIDGNIGIWNVRELQRDNYERRPSIMSRPATRLKQLSELANNKIVKNKKLMDFITSDLGIRFINAIRENGNRRDKIEKEMNAASLVKEWLTKEEWDMLIEHGYVHIPSKLHKDQYYIVFEDPDKRVKVIKKMKIGTTGIINTKNKTKEYHDVIEHRQLYELCGIVDEGNTPDKYEQEFVEWDKMLTKIMAIKANEKYYLKNSNIIH